MNAYDRGAGKSTTGETLERPVKVAEAVRHGKATVSDGDSERAPGRPDRRVSAASGLVRAHSGPRNAVRDGHTGIGANHSAEVKMRTTGKVADSSSSRVVDQVVPPDEDSKRGRSTRRKRIGSVADLVSGWYGNAKKKTLKTPTKAELRAMSVAWRLDETQERHLVKLASADRTLDKTRQLLLLVVGMQQGAVASTLQRFAGLVLQEHPVFHTSSFTTIFGNTSATVNTGDALEERDATKLIHLVMGNELRLLFTVKELGRKRTAELARCRHNAVCCILIWLYLTDRMRLGTAVDYVREHIWAPAVGEHTTESEMLCTVMGARDVAAAGVASALLEARLRDQAASVSAARAAEGRATERARNADAKLTEVSAQLTEARQNNGVLKGQLERERGARAEEASAWTDEYQQLRGGVLRRLREEVSMLEDGLHALKRDPPKVGVMVDHAERVLDSLRREMERLRR